MASNGPVIKLYLDEDVQLQLAVNLRQQGYDCISAHEAGRQRASDEDQLSYATSQGRTILTYNTRDFIPLFKAWWYAGKNHAGIIVSQQLPLGEIQRRVIRLLDAVSADDMRNNVRNLGEFATD